MTRLRSFLLASTLTLAACAPASLAPPASRSFAAVEDPSFAPVSVFSTPRPARPAAANTDIARDFLDLAFMLESGRRLRVLTRFEGPISVRVTGRSNPSMRTDLQNLIGRLRAEAGVPISLTEGPRANITIEAVPRAAIRDLLPAAACFVVPNVASFEEYRRVRRSAVVSWSQMTHRQQLAIFVPSDGTPQETRDCLHEELAQAIGPLNDLYRLPDSVFNDDNVHTVLTGHDMLILQLFYHPSLHSGMSRGEVATRLPRLLSQLNPAGQGIPARGLSATPRDWVTALQTALGPYASTSARQNAALTAVNLSRTLGWTDHRRGLSHYAYGRALQSSNPEAARSHFLEAARFFGTGPETALHRAYTAAQLARDSLSLGRAEEALNLVEPNLIAAHRHENAALLATLMMIKAEALELRGRDSEARHVWLDSESWGLYGFGSEPALRARKREIAALASNRYRRNTP